MLKAVPQQELIDQDRPQRKASGVRQPFGRDLSVHSEESFEVLVEIFDRHRAQFVEDAAHLHPSIRMGIAPIARRNQQTLVLTTHVVQQGVL